MIIEGLVTTMKEDGTAHVAPMGPRLSADGKELVLRPFQSSTTYRNLKRHPEGVFHVTDDVELIARAAVGTVDAPVVAARHVRGHRLQGACRALEFRVTSLDDSEERTTIRANIVHEERVRDFVGFNRAKHSVLEAAILATRIHLLPVGEVRRKLDDLGVLVAKTGGESEARALQVLQNYIDGAVNGDTGSSARGAVEVRAGARLHFGLLAPRGKFPRRFGGAGAMVEEPGLRLRIREGERPVARGPLGPRVLEFARQFLSVEEPPYEFEVTSAPHGHSGLGSGTQLALAVARGLAAIRGESFSAAEAALQLGRGQRSAVGLYGFERGGFIAEAGRGGSEDAVAPMLSSLTIPQAWRFVLIRPQQDEGLSGEQEKRAFRDLPAPREESVDQLCRLLWMGLLPALAEEDFAAFSEALYDFGVRAGELFAPFQGGPFAGRHVERTVKFVRDQGVRGVGQTSWGPTVFALVEGEDAAVRLAAVARQELGADDGDVVVTAPRNRGAEVGTPPGAPSMATLV